MAMSYVASSSGTGATGAASISIAKPTGLAVDDVMVVALTANKNPWTVPSGFTQLQTGESTANAFRSYLYYKVATSTDVAASNFTFSGSDGASPLVGTMIAIRGCNPSNPIMDSDVQVMTSVGSGVDPSATISVTRSSIPARILMWRTDRNQNTFSGTFSESSGGWDIGVQAVGGTGGTRYGSCVIYTGDFGSLGDTTGPAGGIKHDTSTSDNIFFMVALSGVEPVTGDLTASIDVPTVSAVGDVRTSGPLTVPLDPPGVTFNGEHFPPATGAMAIALPVPTVAATGNSIGGSFTASLEVPAMAATGGVASFGGFTTDLPLPAVSFAAETVPFGSHVIQVEAERRAFRVIDADPGLIAIYPWEVT